MQIKSALEIYSEFCEDENDCEFEFDKMQGIFKISTGIYSRFIDKIYLYLTSEIHHTNERGKFIRERK